MMILSGFDVLLVQSDKKPLSRIWNHLILHRCEKENTWIHILITAVKLPNFTQAEYVKTCKDVAHMAINMFLL